MEGDVVGAVGLHHRLIGQDGVAPGYRAAHGGHRHARLLIDGEIQRRAVLIGRVIGFSHAKAPVFSRSLAIMS